MPVRKTRHKGLRVSNVALLWVVFKYDIMAVKVLSDRPPQNNKGFFRQLEKITALSTQSKPHQRYIENRCTFDGVYIACIYSCVQG